MDLLVSCHVLTTRRSWKRLFRDFALQWPKRHLIHLHLHGSGEELTRCLASLEEVASCHNSVRVATPGRRRHTFRVDLHSGYSQFENVHTILWLERRDD